ncbi:MAG: UPF0182 family protein [Leptolyngbyaceae cyanobacterium bins.302]|nr:UPF0182 family protein [Leptolyngbyaceae cyanobacterium bins.302]
MSKDFSIISKSFLGGERSPRFIAPILLLLGVSLVGLWIGTGVLAYLTVESFWFDHLGYLSAFWLRVVTQIVAGAVVTGASLLFVGLNLRSAQRWKHLEIQAQPAEDVLWQGAGRKVDRQGRNQAVPVREPLSRPISFRWLMLAALGISLLTSLLTLHYSRGFWQVGRFATSQPEVLPAIPYRFRFEAVWQLVQQLWAFENPIIPFLGMSLWLAGAIALLIYPRLLLNAIAILLSLGFGMVWAANWSPLLLFFQGKRFGQTEPLFNRDIGFYVFALPVWQLLEFWLIGLVLYTLLAVFLLYLLSGNSLSRGTFPGFSHRQQRHLSGLVGCFMLALGLSYWLRRYELLYSPHGAVYGAAYTEVHVQLPLYTVLTGLTIAIALFLFWQARSQRRQRLKNPERILAKKTKAISWSLLILVSFCLLELVGTTLIPLAVQRIVVQPNELTQEEPYIRRAIALTRAAFNLENIKVETFNPQGNLTSAVLQRNDPTIRNIRLWDTRPLLETNRQLQQIRPYYRFFDADIDRYNLTTQSASTPPAPATDALPPKQQVLISARELDFDAVPADAQTWVNQHMVYTHGYGFTLSPVNRVASGGLPDYFVKDIGSNPDESGAKLTTANAAIRASIPIGEPRIYFGELTNTYIMTNTTVQELDYPSGNDNVYTTYAGAGGIGVGSWWQRWVFARYLSDWKMLLTDSFKPETRVMFRRNIKQRIQAIAPFLRYDQDPYLVTADIGCRGLNLDCAPTTSDPNAPPPNYLYWVVDAYTVSDHYPYSDPSLLQANKTAAAPGDRFNYIRNSVKVVIDAYHGSVNFYVADPDEPMIQAWAKIFPGLFKPLDTLPASLRSHIRYPIDLFSIQSERLMTYHMTDPQVFYNREDQWQIPDEIYGDQPRPVEPYFLITNLPTVVELEEFILLLPFKPTERTNLTAWLAARSDGANYGKQLLYAFPKQQLVFGIEQIEARINQDPMISQQISLWNRQGSRVLQGNLLVIPIEQSLLYVEPLYLEAERNSLPTLVSVVVAYENRIAMAGTLDEALRAVFQPPTTTISPIVRPVE